MKKHKVGSIYTGVFNYQDKPEDSKKRTILLTDIVGENSDIALVTQITSQPPKEPPTYHDQFRKPILKVAEYGLHKKSYVRINKNAFLPINALTKPIGQMDEEEFLEFAKQIMEYIKKNGMRH